MENLIDEIEKTIQRLEIIHKKWFEKIDYPLSQLDILEGKILAYKKILEILNQYNIITAPKSIKLSEIVDRLEKTLNNPKNKVNVYRENENEIVIKITYFARGTFVDEATIEMSNKIWDIDGLISARYKWLYTLWIAGTEIIDDLECDNNE